jgi:serine/threonine protein kinase
MPSSDATGDTGRTADYVGRTLGSYRIVKPLGAGGMGTVFHAQDLNLERDVALKVIAPELARNPVLMNRFKVEAIAQAKLNHKNIVTIHTFSQDETFAEARPTYYFAMEYVEGTTLKAWIVDHGAMPVGHGLQVFSQILDGIGYAHAKGVIHRDIKPANIFLDAHHTAKIGDFGIAKVGGIDGLTRVGSGLGSPMYSAPEQLVGQPADERSDIYSLGMTFYEMLTGTPPIRIGGTPGTARSTDVNPAIPAAVDAVVMKSIAADPKQRYQSVKDFRAAIDALRVSWPDASADRPAPAPAPTVPRKPDLRWVAAGLGLVLLGVVGYLVVSASRNTPPPVIGQGSQGTQPAIAPPAPAPTSSSPSPSAALPSTASSARPAVPAPDVPGTLSRMQKLIARKDYRRAIGLGKSLPETGPLAGDVLQLIGLAYFCDGREAQGDAYVDKALAEAGALTFSLLFETPQKRYVRGTLTVTRHDLTFRPSQVAAPLLALPLAAVKEVSDDWRGDISDLFKKKRNRRMPILVVKSRQGPQYRLQLDGDDANVRKFLKHVINTLRQP